MMSLPAAWRIVPVTATYRYRDGSPVRGEVRFESAKRLVVDGVNVGPGRVTATLDAEGRIALELPSTNDPDLSVTGWVYTVTEHFPGGRKPFELAVDYEAVGIDLAAVAPGPPPPGPPFVVVNAGVCP